MIDPDNAVILGLLFLLAVATVNLPAALRDIYRTITRQLWKD